MVIGLPSGANRYPSQLRSGSHPDADEYALLMETGQETGQRAATTTAELIADLDTLLFELRERLDAYIASGGDDIVAADEGFRVATLVQGSTDAAARHAAEVAAALERLHGISRDP